MFFSDIVGVIDKIKQIHEFLNPPPSLQEQAERANIELENVESEEVLKKKEEATEQSRIKIEILIGEAILDYFVSCETIDTAIFGLTFFSKDLKLKPADILEK